MAFPSSVPAAESADTVVRGPGCDVAADPAAAKRKLVQNISWDASTLATDSIHSQRNGDVSGSEPVGSSPPPITSAANAVAATIAEERSRPLKKRRTALSPPSPPDQAYSTELVSCSASADSPLGVVGGPHEQPEQSAEDSVEPRLSAMELMHGQWAGRGPHHSRSLPRTPPRSRPTATPFPGHHSVNCMHPEGDLVRAHILASWRLLFAANFVPNAPPSSLYGVV